MKENESISRHPSFTAALQLELEAYDGKLEFIPEYELTSDPLKVDVVILKDTQTHIHKNIGRIFRHYNVIEYKSPKDYLSVDDFYKAVAYVYLYKNIARGGVDTIDIREMTLTLVSLYKPIKILQHLQEREKGIYSNEKGVYYIEGMDIPVQVLVQNELPHEENEYLTILTDQLKEKDHLQKVLLDYFKDYKNELYGRMFHAVFEANPVLFMEVINMQKLEHDPEVQEKIDEVLRKFELDKKWKQEEREETSKKIARTLLTEGMSKEYVSKVTDLSIETIKQLEQRSLLYMELKRIQYVGY